MDVHVDSCLDKIVAGGVQICGLHATVAPRRQHQQSPPTLEEFVFAPYVETECLTADEKLTEQLRICTGKQIEPSVIVVMYNFPSLQITFKILNTTIFFFFITDTLCLPFAIFYNVLYIEHL